MLLVLCDDALVPQVREWCRDALRTGLTSVTGQVALVAEVACIPQPSAADDPCVFWLGSNAERDVIETAAAAASQIVLLLGGIAGRHAHSAGSGEHKADVWHAVATVTAPRIAVWMPAANGARPDPTGELSAALGAQRVVRISRVGSRRAHRQLHRLGRTLVASACAPQRLDRSDGAVRRRDAARAATDALSDLLAEPDVEEFQIRGGESMLVQYAGGRVERRPSPFAADEDLIEAVRFLASYSGDRPQRFDELDPRLDVRVGDRWRLHAEAFVTSPPNVVLRSNMAGRMRLDDLAVVSRELGSVLIEAIAGKVRANVVVAASMGGGKTTLCQALLAAVPDHERIDTIEDTPELRLGEYGIHPNTYERLTRDPKPGRSRSAFDGRPHSRCEACECQQARGGGNPRATAVRRCSMPCRRAWTVALSPCIHSLARVCSKSSWPTPASEGAEPDYARRQIAAAADLCVWMGRNDAGERVVADVTQLTGIDDITGIISTTCLWALRPGDRWATPVGRPVGRVAEVYASVGLSQAGGEIELPDVFSQIIDASVPLNSGEPAAAVDAPADPPLRTPSQHDKPQHGELLLGTPLHDGADPREVLWDPGPLVPIDEVHPYEPLVGESRSYRAVGPNPDQCAAIGHRPSTRSSPSAGDGTPAEGIAC